MTASQIYVIEEKKHYLNYTPEKRAVSMKIFTWIV